MKCDICGIEFEPGIREDGLPNGVGLVLENGVVINVCHDCLMDAATPEKRGAVMARLEEIAKEKGE